MGKVSRTHPEERERSLRAAYYAALNEHVPFQRALRKLFGKYLRDPFTRSPLTPSEKELKKEMEKRGLPWLSADFKGAPSQALEKDSVDFATRWKLPRHAWDPKTLKSPELYTSFLRWKPESSEESGRDMDGPDDKDDDLAQPLLSSSGPTWIEPPLLTLCASPGVIFDHTIHSLRDAKRIVSNHLDQLRREAHSKVHDHLKRAEREGWATPPPLRRGDELGKLGRRLFRRAILEWTWGEIAEKESKEEGHVGPNVQSIMMSTREIARELGIALPKVQGRRRKER